MVRGLIDDGVPSRLGADAFTLACVLTDQQDYAGRTSIGFWREQLCKRCGFPASNTERLRGARKKLQADGWLEFTSPKNGDRAETMYRMILKRPGRIPSSDPGESRTPSLPSISIPISSIPNTPPTPLKGELFSKGFDEPKKEEANSRSSEAQVRAIYDAYPRKVKPLDAHMAIAKALKQVGFDELLSLTERYAAARTKPGQDPRYTPHPSTWFNQGRWMDDPAEWERLDDVSKSLQTIPVGRENDPTRIRTGSKAAAIAAARAKAAGAGQVGNRNICGRDNSAYIFDNATRSPGVDGRDGK